MIDPVVSLVPIRAGELAVGQPVPRALFDWHGKLLLAAGCTVDTQDQLDSLLDNGFVQDNAWDAPAAPSKLPQQISDIPPKAIPADSPTDDSDGGKETLIGMDEVRWHVGETLYLQLLDNSAIRYTVRLIGFVKGKTVLVTMPAADGKLEFIRDGQTFVARAFSGKKAYAFVTSAVKSLHSPHPYLHLTYPKEVRCTVVRRGVRAQVAIVASVSLGEPARTAAATLTDLSMGGASGIVRQPIGNTGDGGQIKFKVQAAGRDEYLSLKTVLRSAAPAENGEGFKYGFEFLDVPIHDRLILSAFVHQTLAEGE